ncbi:phage holin family protein [Mixta calida]|uniref:phage holin family protein n=1 Tax=Mixta calida TaxID=665913 RepID=UPI0034D3E176
MLNDILCIIDAAICIAIALRIIFFRKHGRQYKHRISWLAAAIAIFYGNLPLLYLYDHYVLADWPVIITNSILCAAVYRARGNVAHLLRRAD